VYKRQIRRPGRLESGEYRTGEKRLAVLKLPLSLIHIFAISSFEHALYGCWLFTIGLGQYFYHGTICLLYTSRCV